MALVSAIISSGFADMIATKPATAQAACNQLADIYNTYAIPAQAGAATPILTGSEKIRFAQTLFGVLGVVPPSGSPASAAAAFVAAVTTFWLTPPVVFGAGAVTAFAGAGVLQLTLTTLFGAFNDAVTVSQGLANALDVATKTVTVVIGTNTFTLT